MYQLMCSLSSTQRQLHSNMAHGCSKHPAVNHSQVCPIPAAHTHHPSNPDGKAHSTCAHMLLGMQYWPFHMSFIRVFYTETQPHKSRSITPSTRHRLRVTPSLNCCQTS
eukprot:GHRQ01003247.1.p4 GENE.GHRQ01003247.1~~GHRQ01003247.1.p4  ORF type:complete len:109 (-),score=5.31 GHRQ01003247.1:1046-1372(-)